MMETTNQVQTTQKNQKTGAAQTKNQFLIRKKQQMKMYLHHPGSLLLKLLVLASAVITVGVLIYLVAYILIHGVPYLTADMFALEYNSENVSLFPALINTITMTFLSLLISVPFGIGAAIYLVEYA